MEHESAVASAPSSARSRMEFRGNRLIVITPEVLPLIFLIESTVSLLAIKATATSAVLDKRVDSSLFLPLIVPVIVPAVMSAFNVVKERDMERNHVRTNPGQHD